MTTPQEGASLPELNAEQNATCRAIANGASSLLAAARSGMVAGIAIGRASDSASVQRDAFRDGMLEAARIAKHTDCDADPQSIAEDIRAHAAHDDDLAHTERTDR